MNRRLAIVAVTAALCTLPGCMGADGKFSKSNFSPFAEPPAPAIRELQTMWETRVVETEDVVNDGAKLHGLAGRVYFIGPKNGYPVAAKGTLTVTAHEVLPDKKTVPIERWVIDPVTLQRLGSTDRMGWGYTLYLPLSKYRPEVHRVQFQVKFTPEKGVPLFAPTEDVSLTDEAPPVITSSNILPAGGFPARRK